MVFVLVKEINGKNLFCLFYNPKENESGEKQIYIYIRKIEQFLLKQKKRKNHMKKIIEKNISGEDF